MTLDCLSCSICPLYTFPCGLQFWLGKSRLTFLQDFNFLFFWLIKSIHGVSKQYKSSLLSHRADWVRGTWTSFVCTGNASGSFLSTNEGNCSCSWRIGTCWKLEPGNQTSAPKKKRWRACSSEALLLWFVSVKQDLTLWRSKGECTGGRYEITAQAC